MTKKSTGALLTLLLLSACGGGGTYKKSPVVTPQRMTCTDGTPSQITLFSPEEAKLVFHENTYNLTRTATPSGVKYENSQISYWNKGIEAIITAKNAPPMACAYIPKSGL